MSRLGRAAAGLVMVMAVAPEAAVAQCVVGSNGALSFDGVNDCATLPSHPLLDGFADFTFEFWFRTLNSSAQYMAGIVKRESLTVARPYWLGFAAGRLDLRLNFGALVLTGQQLVANGTWHHGAATRTGTAITMYVDGIPYMTGTYGALLNAAASSLELGSEHVALGPGYEYYTGSLDEVRVWSMARTQSEIQATMNVGLTGTEPGLVGYWRLDEAPAPGQQSVLNSALATGSALDGTLGTSAVVGSDDPARITTGVSPLPYCAPCPTPPCGQVNSGCASLTVNGVGANAQGPFNVVVPPGGSVTFNWAGPANQPVVLVGTSNLVPGQSVLPGSCVVDVNLANMVVLFSGLDPFWSPLCLTNGAGVSSQTFGAPTPSPGFTLNVQGLIFDSGLTCRGGLGFLSTASFMIHL